MKLAEIQTWKYEELTKPSPPVPYGGEWISPWHHPTTIAKDLLRDVKHYGISGMQFVGPMGQGKTKFATVIAHHVHKIAPEYSIVWGDDDDFTHIKRFAEDIPKVPTIAIFDDVTGALKEKGSGAMHANFKDLTKIRHIFNEAGAGDIPIMIFVVFHYSLNLEKQYRNVLRNTAFLGFSNTERTNIDIITPKDSQARYELLKFARIFHDMNSEGEIFKLKTNNAIKEFKLDEPFRPCCVVSGTEAHVVLFTDNDYCNLCSQKKSKIYLDAKDVFDKIKDAYGLYGIQALRLSLWKRGHTRAVNPKTGSASEFIEGKIFAKYDTDYEELTNWIYKDSRKHIPKRIYRKHSVEEKLSDDLHAVSKIRHDESEMDDPLV